MFFYVIKVTDIRSRTLYNQVFHDQMYSSTAFDVHIIFSSAQFEFYTYIFNLNILERTMGNKIR